jgi:serine phosphatase RsbU (regulator of sigma subunit)
MSENIEQASESLLKAINKIKSVPDKLVYEIKQIITHQSKVMDKLKYVLKKYEGEEATFEQLEKSLREFRMQNEIAKNFQSSIFPTNLPNNELISIRAKLISMGETSGDFYDVAELIPNSVYGVMLSDIQGHGVSAALVTTLAKMLFVSATEKFISTKDVLGYINDEICRILSLTSFFTAFYIVFDFPNKQFFYSAAGDLNFRYNFKTKEVEPLTSNDTIIGFVEGGEYEEKVLDFNVGDRLVLFTDGVTEAKNPKTEELFGSERLKNLIKDNADAPSKKLLEIIEESVKDFSGKNQFDDDFTLIIIDIKSDKSRAKSEKMSSSYSRDDLSRMIEYYQKSVLIKEQHNDKHGMVKDLIQLGTYLPAKGRINEALKYLKRAEKLSIKAGNNKSLGDIYSKLGDIFTKLGNLDKALIYQKKGLSNYIKIHELSGIATSYNSMYIIYSNKGEKEKSRKYLYKALDVKNNMKQTKGIKRDIASLYNNLGVSYNDQSMNEEALKYYQKGLDIALELDIIELQAALLNNIGDVNRIKANYDNALEYLHKCLYILEEIDNHDLLIIALTNLSDIYFKIDDQQMSRYYIKKAVYMAEKYNLVALESFTKTIRAYNLIKSGDIEKGIKDLKESMEIVNKIKFDITQGFTKTLLGILIGNIEQYQHHKDDIIQLNYLFFDEIKPVEFYYEQGVKETEEPINTDFNIPALYEYGSYLYSIGKEQKAIYIFNTAINTSKKYNNVSELNATLNRAAKISIKLD